MDRFVEVDLIVVSRALLLELIAFGEAGCFGAADAAGLLGCWNTAQGCWLIGCWVLRLLLSSCLRAEKALLGCWVLGAAIAAE
jgi:hypothetical protein